MHWNTNVTSSDISGILKRKTTKVTSTNNHKDLLVFGYAAKLFKDDVRALSIDQGKHLLEWCGEKVDRYDVRSTLLDAGQLEPPIGGYGNRLEYLSPEELRAEQLAEEERYYAINHNEEEELLYQEEELKRLLHEKNSKYAQIQFDYRAETNEVNSANDQNKEENKYEEPDQPYVQPSSLDIPVSIQLPDTMNEHIIIEKTARFISSQGPQMEILIKAKQSNNPKFEFLNQNNKLNPYYKFLLMSITSGKYIEDASAEQNVNAIEDKYFSSNTNQTDMLESTSLPKITATQPLPYKPSANCAYTQLISKIKGVPIPDFLATKDSALDTSRISNSKAVNVDSQSNQNSPLLTKDVEIKKLSSGLMLAQAYASDTEDENEDNGIEDGNQNSKKIPIPPEDVQNIIDKTAAYVLKNGKQFEETLKLKGDKRFKFLNKSDQYFEYYMFKIESLGKQHVNKVESEKKKLTPVCFSIKPKDDIPVQIKPVLSDDLSDEEQSLQNNLIGQQNNICNTNGEQTNQFSHSGQLPENVQKAVQLVEKQLVAKIAKSNIDMRFQERENLTRDFAKQDVFVQTSNLFNVGEKKSKAEQMKELKLAEERVKDKLAQRAREKLGLISKEKQLQLERKKKAKAFLNQIKDFKTSADKNTTATTCSAKKDEIIEINSIEHLEKIDISKAKNLTDEKIEIITSSVPNSPEPAPASGKNKSKSWSRSRSRSRSRSKVKKRKSKSSRRHSKKKSRRNSSERRPSRHDSNHSSDKKMHKSHKKLKKKRIDYDS